MLRAKTAPPRRAGRARSLAPTLNGLRIVRCGGNAVVEKETTGSTRTAMAAAEQISVDTHLFMQQPQQRLLRLFVGVMITLSRSVSKLGPTTASGYLLALPKRQKTPLVILIRARYRDRAILVASTTVVGLLYESAVLVAPSQVAPFSKKKEKKGTGSATNDDKRRS